MDTDPEVLRLLRGILSTLQVLNQEVRDCRARLGWQPVVQRDPAVNSSGLRQVQDAPVGTPPRRVIVRAGRQAAERMRVLRAARRLTQQAVADRLGISAAMVGFIEHGKNSITNRVDAAMRRLEKETTA